MKLSNKFLTICAMMICAAMLCMLAGCGSGGGGDNSSSNSNTGYNDSNTSPQTNGNILQEPEGAGYFYFSYDDSASTVAVELTKYLLNNSMLPSSAYSRPWEFLNYETFDSSNTESSGLFNVSMGVIKRELAETSDNSEYHLGIYIESPEISKEVRQNVVLTLIVDVSGSMNGMSTRVEEVQSTSLDVVKYGLNKLADSLKEGDIINLVTFSTTADIILQGVTYSEIADVFVNEVNQLATIASTNLNAGINKGYAAALETFDSTKMNRVVILTDANANTGEVDSTKISENTDRNEQEGIYFSGIGIGDNFNEAFLNELTEEGKGSYFSVITRADAQRAFQDRFVALMMVAAKHASFRIDFPEDFAHSTTASEESSAEQDDVQPTNFSYNTSQYFYEVFEGITDVDLSQEFKLTITYKDPVSLETKTEIITKSISEILGQQESNVRDAEMIFLFNQLLGGNMLWSDIENIILTYYPSYSSSIFDEYNGLMDKYNILKTQ